MNQLLELYRKYLKKSDLLRLSNHDFCFSLYAVLAKKNTENIIYSPLSIHMMMFMASIGADSKTFDEIVATLNLNKSDYSLGAYHEILSYISSNNNILKLATGMFVDKHFKIKRNFVKNCARYIDSSVERLDFRNDPEAQRLHINKWVSKKTMNEINVLFAEGDSSINKHTGLILTNAVHFKCKWKNEFTDTSNRKFYLTPKNTITVKMMHLEKKLPYYHNDELKFGALELPYKHGNCKMTILLPDELDGLKNLEANLSKIKINEISKNMTKHYEVIVKLPSFKFDKSFELNQILSLLGCPTMFTESANFTKIVDDNGDGDKLYVTNLIHKATIDVDEKGTVATAVTTVNYKLGSAPGTPPPPPKVIYFTADHPFIFYISSEDQNLLFFGRINDLPSCSENHSHFEDFGRINDLPSGSEIFHFEYIGNVEDHLTY